MKHTVPALAFLVAVGGVASAGTFSFQAYTNNSGSSGNIVTSATLSADATSFTILLQNGSSQGAITDFYLETGAALSALTGPSISNGPGVAFSPNAEPPTPHNIHTTAGGAWSGNFFSMDSDSPIIDHGVAPGEWVSVTFSHDGSFSLAALETAINNNDIRLVQHYQSWEGGTSEWLTTATVVPLPPAAWAGLGTIACLVGVRGWKKRRS